MKLFLVDGTYELFRSHFGAPPRVAPDGQPVGAVTGLVQSLLMLLREQRPDFVACAFDSVVESFRNDLFDGYKSGEAVPPELLSQFPIAERASRSLGITTWPMVKFEADDAIATAVDRWRAEAELDQIVICSVDKDLMNLVEGDRVVLWDRRRDITYSEPEVIDRFGVVPSAIPDYLGLVGDSADGIPGIPRWGAKSTAVVLSEYRTLGAIPDSYEHWSVTVRGGKTLAQNLAQNRASAELYRTLAVLRRDVPLVEALRNLRWAGVPRDEFLSFCDDLGLERLKTAPLAWE